VGVILDVVYNHLGPEGITLGRVRPDFYGLYHTPLGARPELRLRGDDRDSDPVRSSSSTCNDGGARFHVDGAPGMRANDLTFHSTYFCELKRRYSKLPRERGAKWS